MISIPAMSQTADQPCRLRRIVLRFLQSLTMASTAASTVPLLRTTTISGFRPSLLYNRHRNENATSRLTSGRQAHMLSGSLSIRYSLTRPGNMRANRAHHLSWRRQRRLVSTTRSTITSRTHLSQTTTSTSFKSSLISSSSRPSHTSSQVKAM